ncbi:MAG: hypothetical protein K940chlam5_01619 [Candidatus Anoxychlamydiales bacterium]|nr:hypothetical protein [Candidatus Anoxychlamydiales bacterium]
MKLLDKRINKKELQKIADERFGDLVKVVVDIKNEIMVVGGELHSDEEAKLLQDHGSNQNDLWGINLYPANEGDKFLEFDSLINIRPSLNNRSRDVMDPNIRKKIIDIVNKLIEKG